MVKRMISLGQSGITNWLIQRISAVLMLGYVAFLIGFYLGHSTIDYNTWYTLFSFSAMRFFNVLVLLALLGHAWIGIWTILTDYIKRAFLCAVIQGIIIFVFLICLTWGIQIFWS